MKLHLLCKRAITVILLTVATAMAGSSGKAIIKSVKTMEQVLGVKMIEPGDLGKRSQPTAPSPDDAYMGSALEVSADGTAVVWYPRISPDGKRLAFVDDKDKLWIHSFADGSKIQLLKGKSVKGVGGWSPDGRFLLAGAWTTLFAFSKRQIIIDTTTGEYAVIGKLGEGDYGTQYAWISVELVKQTRAQ